MVSEVSIIIVNFNCGDHLRVCIASLYEHLRVPFEVIVVDNHSSDRSVLAVQEVFPTTRIILNRSNVGFARASNQGAAIACGDILLFLNPDARLIDDGLNALFHTITNNPQIGAMGTAFILPNGTLVKSILFRIEPWLYVVDSLIVFFPLVSWWLWRRMRKETRNFTQHARVDWLIGACLVIRRSLFATLGGFDEGTFLYGEDIDIGLRVGRAGYEVWYDPNIRLEHIIGLSSNSHYHIKIPAYYQYQLYYGYKLLGRTATNIIRVLAVPKILLKMAVKRITCRKRPEELRQRLLGYRRGLYIVTHPVLTLAEFCELIGQPKP